MPNDSGSRKNLAPQELFAQALPMLDSVIGRACSHFYHYPTSENTKLLRQRLIVLLLEDDHRRLRTYDQRAELNTWLQTLANHYVSRYLQRERRGVSLDGFPVDSFTSAPTQEDDVWREEKVRLLKKAINRLTKQGRRLFALLQEELTAEKLPGGWRSRKHRSIE